MMNTWTSWMTVWHVMKRVLEDLLCYELVICYVKLDIYTFARKQTSDIREHPPTNWNPPSEQCSDVSVLKDTSHNWLLEYAGFFFFLGSGSYGIFFPTLLLSFFLSGSYSIFFSICLLWYFFFLPGFYGIFFVLSGCYGICSFRLHI